MIFKVGDILYANDDNHITSLIITGCRHDARYDVPAVYDWVEVGGKKRGVESARVMEKYYFKKYNFNRIWNDINNSQKED